MKKLLIPGVLILAIGFYFLYPKYRDYRERTRLTEENEAALKEAKNASMKNNSNTDSNFVLPEKAYLEVPFYCQAPHQNAPSWKIHHASCEEAAVLQAADFQRKIAHRSVDTLDRIFQDMISWQEKNWGVHKDIHADSVKMLMMAYLGYKDEEIKILRKAKINDLKNWVARGYPIIAPTYGRTLNNPFFTPPGPTYHMVTVIGYTADRIITNDVGTKRGKDYSYPNDIFQRSMDEEGADCLVILAKLP